MKIAVVEETYVKTSDKVHDDTIFSELSLKRNARGNVAVHRTDES